MAKRANLQKLAKTRPKAMVKPAPDGPSPAKKQTYRQTAFAGSDPSLAVVLQQLGNDRAYTILKSEHLLWVVHFEGDTTPSIVKLVDGKWVITKIKAIIN